MPPKTRAGLKRPRAANFQCWLMKSEPHKFSIDHLADMKTSPWDGVRNYAARNNMKSMQVGDKVLFYHSNTKEPGVAGLAEVHTLAYADHTALDKDSDYYDPKATPEGNPWQMVDVRFVAKFAHPVSLHRLKADKALQGMALFSQSRLSVQPVPVDAYEHIVAMASSSHSSSPDHTEPVKKKKRTLKR